MWNILIQLGISLILTWALRAKTPGPPKPPAFEDVRLPQSAEGTPQAMDFGTVWSGDWMVLGATNYRAESIRRKARKK